MPKQPSRGTSWQRVAVRLRSEIDAGRFKAGETLPIEAELARRLETTRDKLRLALRNLALQGVLRLQQSEAVVLGRMVEFPLGQDASLIEALRRQGIEPARKVMATGVERANADELEILGLSPAALIARIEILTSGNGQNYAFTVHRCPAARLPGVIEQMRKRGSLEDALRELGHASGQYAWARLSAQLPEARIAKILARPTSQPILKVDTLTVTASGEPLDLAESYFAGDCARILIDTPSPSPKKAARKRAV